MRDKSPESLLGSLPDSRPHRRSEKRAAQPQRQAAPQPPPRSPSPPGATELVAITVRAAAELAEIGLTVSARALRIALSRLPHR